MATGSKLKNTVTDFSLNPMSLDHVRVVPGNKEGFFVRKGGGANQPDCCRLCALLHLRHTPQSQRLSMCRGVAVFTAAAAGNAARPRAPTIAFAVPGAASRVPLTAN